MKRYRAIFAERRNGNLDTYPVEIDARSLREARSIATSMALARKARVLEVKLRADAPCVAQGAGGPAKDGIDGRE